MIFKSHDSKRSYFMADVPFNRGNEHDGQYAFDVTGEDNFGEKIVVCSNTPEAELRRLRDHLTAILEA